MSAFGLRCHNFSNAIHGFTIRRFVAAGSERIRKFALVSGFKIASGRSQSLVIHSFFVVGPPEPEVIGRLVWPYGKQCLKDGDGFVVSTQIVQIPAVVALSEFV